MEPGHSARQPCCATVLEYPRYFPRQLLTPAELTLEQDYLRDRMRRHNRLLHGWGVVCGAEVGPALSPQAVPEPWKVTVQSGYVLGPYGDEIVIDGHRTVDLRSSGVSGACGDPPGEVVDPWCTPVPIDRTPGLLYVAVRYVQLRTRPVRAQPVGCGCDDSQCEYSRVRDGYEICVLTECPPSHRDVCTDAAAPAVQPQAGAVKRSAGPGQGGSPMFRLDGNQVIVPLSPCPPCPDDPWVVLASVRVDENGTVTPDNCACRRMVLTPAQFVVRCQPGAFGELPPAERLPRPAEPEPSPAKPMEPTRKSSRRAPT